MHKASTRGADVLIFDLEDGVADGAKPRAREVLARALADPSSTPRYVRVNHPAAGWLREDIEATLTPHLTGYILPKAEFAEDIRTFLECVRDAAQERGVDAAAIAVVPLIETAAGVESACAIAAASPHIRRLAFGAVDLALDLRVEALDPAVVQYVRSRLVIAARAAGLEAPIDTVEPDYRDLAAFRDAAMAARRMGFGGKLVIHPNQVAVANEVFAPTARERAEAERIVQAYERAAAEGVGAVGLDGRMVDRPMYEWALRVLADAGLQPN